MTRQGILKDAGESGDISGALNRTRKNWGQEKAKKEEIWISKNSYKDWKMNDCPLRVKHNGFKFHIWWFVGNDETIIVSVSFSVTPRIYSLASDNWESGDPVCGLIDNSVCLACKL